MLQLGVVPTFVIASVCLRYLVLFIPHVEFAGFSTKKILPVSHPGIKRSVCCQYSSLAVIKAGVHSKVAD